MLYLVKPDHSTEWVDLPAKLVLEHARKGELNLDKIPWDPAERIADEMTIRLALRYGVACPRGIAVAATELSGTDRARQLIEAHAAAQASQEALRPNDELMEHLMPGWIESGRNLDVEVTKSVEESIARARRELDKRLSEKEPQDDLVAHWAAMGGLVPSPL